MGSGATGKEDTDFDGVLEIDCTHLPWEAIKAALPYPYRVEFPYMTTNYFRKQPGASWPKQRYRDLFRSLFYCEVDVLEADTGDIIVWEQPSNPDYGHMGIVITNTPDPQGYYRSGMAYNSTSLRNRRPEYPLDIFYKPKNPNDPKGWTGPAASPWNWYQGVTFWRPKVCECPGRPPGRGPIGQLPYWYKSARSSPPIDPLALDLDGDGIRTIAIDNGVFFDHDANGFHEHTGWVAHGDGMLMLDWNNNGRLDSGMELFGEYTLLSTGTPVGGDGFQVLSLHDANHDGKIDAEDPIWSQLKVWQYGEDDLENYDPDESGIISTVEELGITAIYLDSEVCNETDSEGNTQVGSGVFQWADGSTGLVAEYSFTRDTSYTLPTEYLEVPEDVLALPDLMFNGNVYNLQQEMVRDSSGVLKSLVESFISEESSDNRGSIMEQILFRWTGADQVSPEARGPFMDARKVVVLEQLYGETPANPDSGQAASWEATYHEVFEIFYADLMAQTHLKGLYETITFTWNEETQDYDIDTTGLIAALDDSLAADPDKGKELLSEFARTRRGMGYWDDNCFLSLREHFIQQDPELGWIFDTGGLPVYDAPHQGTRTWSNHIEGTDNADAVKGSLTEGNQSINGLNGDDVVYGTSRPFEALYNGSGDAILVGGGGTDTIWAGSGADILDGGADDDLLIGQEGDDVYLFRPGSGHDVIRDVDATEDNVDTIWLGGNLTPDDITLKRSGNYLVLEIIATGDTISVEDFFRFDSYLKRVEQIQFMDGTTWDETEMIERAYAPTDGPDRIYGGPGDDEISGQGGADKIYGLGGNDTLYGDEANDRLYGGAGLDTLEGGPGADDLYGNEDDDILIGGSGPDYLEGGTGNDVYRFSLGFGHDTIYDMDTTPGNTDTIEFEEGILPSDVKLRRSGDHLELTVTDTGDTITVKDWLVNDTPVHGIELITFADGTMWDTATIQDMLVKGTEEADTIIGFSGADSMEGFGSDDTLYGRGGDDTITSGDGADALFGEDGNDVLSAGDGADRLQGGKGDDTLDGGSGNDMLFGGVEVNSWYYAYHDDANGNDTYVFGRGYGQDTIVDHDYTPGNVDAIRLADDIAPEDVVIRQWGDDLQLTINNTTDKLVVENWYWNDSAEYQVEQIEFSDGTVWNVDDIKYLAIQGTADEDRLKGYSTSDTIHGYEGDDFIYGRDGDDVVDSGSGDDWVAGESGDDILVAGAGEDTVIGGSGNDTLDSGADNDLLYGGTMYETKDKWFDPEVSNGNDTYLFGRGYGQDEIFDRDAVAGNLDTILLGDDIIVADVNVRHVDDDLVLAIVGTNDSLTVHNWFLGDSTEWQVELIQFADGTTWDVDTIKQMTLQGTPGDDILIGYSTGDTIVGYAGNDTLLGQDGQDTLLGGDGADELVGGSDSDFLDGGADADLLMGGLGNDTYLFGRGSGNDTIVDQDSTPGNHDTILLDGDILPDDVTVRRINDSLVLTITDTGDTLSVEKWFLEESTEWQVEEIRFADGTTWDVDTIKQMALQGTPGDDTITGYSTSDTILGLAGADVLYGRDSADTLDGGADADQLYGGFGNDIYLFERGSGQDVIVDWDPTPGNIDTVRVGSDVQKSDVTLKRAGNHLFVSINGTDDSVKLSDWFSADADKIEQIQFGDGTIWDAAYMYTKTTTPTDTDDYLVGTSDKDLMDGGGGDDVLYGRENADTLFGGSGQDEIYAEEGNDTVYGGSDNDRLYSGSGDDRLFGEAGDDYLEAQSGNNELDGGSGNDELVASSGDDQLVGGAGADRLDPGAGTNILEGGADDDEIIAEQGQNTILFNQGDGFDTVYSRIESTAAEGAVMVKNLAPNGGMDCMVEDFVAANGLLFCNILEITDSTDYHLWRSDGTESGTFTISGAFPDIAAEAKDLTEVNGTLFFTAENWNYGRELWKTDGTDAGTVMVKDINTAGGWEGAEGGNPSELINVDGMLFFTADDGDGGALWKSDGTDAGTVMVTRFSTFTEHYYLTAANGTVFFRDSDGVHGYELWTSDGTEAGTFMVRDISTGSSSTWFSEMTGVNDTLFFRVDDGIHGEELWKSDGTEAGTVMVKDITSGSASTSLRSFTNVNGTLFFVADDGTILTLDEILSMADGVIGYQEGTDNDDILGGSFLDDEIYGLGANDEIVGRDDDYYEAPGDRNDEKGSVLLRRAFDCPPCVVTGCAE